MKVSLRLALLTVLQLTAAGPPLDLPGSTQDTTLGPSTELSLLPAQLQAPYSPPEPCPPGTLIADHHCRDNDPARKGAAYSISCLRIVDYHTKRGKLSRKAAVTRIKGYCPKPLLCEQWGDFWPGQRRLELDPARLPPRRIVCVESKAKGKHRHGWHLGGRPRRGDPSSSSVQPRPPCPDTAAATVPASQQEYQQQQQQQQQQRSWIDDLLANWPPSSR